jgi:hypothetical protein
MLFTSAAWGQNPYYLPYDVARAQADAYRTQGDQSQLVGARSQFVADLTSGNVGQLGQDLNTISADQQRVAYDRYNNAVDGQRIANDIYGNAPQPAYVQPGYGQPGGYVAPQPYGGYVAPQPY